MRDDHFLCRAGLQQGLQRDRSCSDDPSSAVAYDLIDIHGNGDRMREHAVLHESQLWSDVTELIPTP